MANNIIGGYLVKLGLLIDKNTFNVGESTIGKFIGTATKATAAAAGMAKVAGVVENNNLKLAKAIGISGSELKAWQDSASKAGVSASALTSSMAQIENKMQKLKTGQMDEGLAKSLGLLGLDYGNFAQMDATERMRAVFGAANGMQDQAKAAMLVGDTLGSAAREYYDWLALSGRTLDQELDASRALNFTTEGTMKSASAFNAEFNGLLNSTKSIAMLIGSKIGESLTPIMRTLQRILAMNKELITSGIIGVIDTFGRLSEVFKKIGTLLTGETDPSKAFEKIATGVSKFAGTAIETSIKLLNDLVDIIDALFSKPWNEVGENIKKFFQDFGDGVKNIVVGDTKPEEVAKKTTAAGAVQKAVLAVTGTNAEKAELNDAIMKRWENKQAAIDDLKAQIIANEYGGKAPGLFGKKKASEMSQSSKDLINAFIDEYDLKEGDESLNGFVSGLNPFWRNPFAKMKHVNDGIVAPGGNVTQVAPDDWVIAARNLGDVASAFMPQGLAQATTNNSNASYVINQSFSFQGGSTNATEVMRQAYSGTQSGLLAAMNRGTQRIQLMPGLR